MAALRKGLDPFEFKKRLSVLAANVATQQECDFAGFYAIS
jgi:hypothetical protein